MAKVDDLLQSRTKQIDLAVVTWLAHGCPPDGESRRRGNHEPPKSGIPKRKKTATHNRLSCKIEYLLRSNHRDSSTASEFFTGDYVVSWRRWSILGWPPALPKSPGSRSRYSVEHCRSRRRKRLPVAATQALKTALGVALRTMHNEPKAASSYLHKALAATLGAVGGSFGLAALPIELPIS